MTRPQYWGSGRAPQAGWKLAEFGVPYGPSAVSDKRDYYEILGVGRDADASELKLDPIVDGAFAGKPDLVESEFAKAMVAGTYPGVIISAAQRQAAWLHKSALALAEGTPVSTLLDGGSPRLHFSRKAGVEIALRSLSAPRLLAIIEQLAVAALDMRKQAALAAAIAQRTLLSIAVSARRRG